MENLHSALKMVTELRAMSAILWQTTADGMGARHGREEGREKRFLSELKSLLDGVATQVRYRLGYGSNGNVRHIHSNLLDTLFSDLEKCLNEYQHAVNPPLGQSIYLSLDAAHDSVPVYNGLVNSYKWLDKAHEYAGGAASMLSQNSLNRSYGKVAKNRKSRPTNNSYTAPPQ